MGLGRLAAVEFQYIFGRADACTEQRFTQREIKTYADGVPQGTGKGAQQNASDQHRSD